MDEQSQSAQSAESQESQEAQQPQSVYEELQNDGEWLVAVRYDSLGSVEGYTAIRYSDGESLIFSALEEEVGNQVDAMESVSGDSQNAEETHAPEVVIMHCCVILVFAVLACVGAIACQTLMRSMELK